MGHTLNLAISHESGYRQHGLTFEIKDRVERGDVLFCIKFMMERSWEALFSIYMKTTFLSFFIFFIITPSFLLYNLFHDEANCSELHTYKISNPLNRILNCLIWMVQDSVVDAVNQITMGWAQSTFALRYYSVEKTGANTQSFFILYCNTISWI